jgi:UDP-glucose 4-epimerase
MDSRHTPTRAVVTGGSGFIGGHLVAALLARGDDVTVFDKVPPAGSLASEIRFVKGDLRDHNQLGRAIRSGVDVVYHMAAVVGVDRYLARPLDVIDVNYTGSRNVLELSHRAGARVLLASTSEVFGKNPAVPWTEDSDRVLGATSTARWSYSSSKALAEHLAFAFAEQNGLPMTIVRYFNVYGPCQRPAYVVSRSIHRALNGHPLVIYDNGRQTRCFTYVDDAIDGTLLAVDHAAATCQAFNIGSMTETPVGMAVRLIAELSGQSTISEVDTADRLGSSYADLSRRIPDSGKARAMLGWECRTGLRDGLLRTIEWARTAPWWLNLPDSGAE